MELTLRTLPRVLHKTQTVSCRRISLCHTRLYQNRVNEKSLVAARLSTKSVIVAERTLFQMLPVVYWQTNRHMAGHSKFSNIKHRKEAQDSKKSALMGQYVKLAQSAVKMGGSTDPKLNPKLAQVIESAKKSSLGVETIKKLLERMNMDSGRKKQFRFSEQDDIKMLREVISRNPFKDRGKWLEISLALPMSVDARRVRERTVLQMEQRRKANSSSLKKSGVDEVYGEKEILLDEILDLANDEEEKKKDDKSKAIKEEVLCKDIRKRALDNLTPSKSDENLKKMPKKSASVMSFLKEKAELEKKSKEDELALRREQFNLEKERFEIEKQERLQKLEMEKQQSKLMFELFSKCLNK